MTHECESNALKQEPKDEEAEEISSLFRGTKREYRKISYEKRHELLSIIEHDQVTIKSAAIRLNINYSTAKNIVKIFRHEKRINTLPKKTQRPSVPRLGSSEERASQSLEEGKQRDDGRMKRFVARKTHLELSNDEPRTTQGPPNTSPALVPLKDARRDLRLPDDLTSESAKAPHFDFGVYSYLILEK